MRTHGKGSTYRAGCRCDECRAAVAAQAMTYYRANRAKINAQTLTRYHARRQAWLQENGPCRHCGSWDNLEVDHVDPQTKDPYLRKAIGSDLWSWPEARRLAELTKCQVLCRSCHQIKSMEERQK